MAFPDITALQGYINTYIKTNNSRAIKGAELNTALNGILQFLIPATISTYTMSIPSSGGVTTASSFVIPLTFTPTSCIVQAASDIVGVVGSITGLAILSSVPTTNGITVYYARNLTTAKTITFSYIAS